MLEASRHAEKKHSARRKERTIDNGINNVRAVPLWHLVRKGRQLQFCRRLGSVRATRTLLQQTGAEHERQRRQRTRKRKLCNVPEVTTRDLHRFTRSALKRLHCNFTSNGVLYQLSDSLLAKIRSIASTGLYSIVYDNINMMFRSPEQIVVRHGRLW